MNIHTGLRVISALGVVLLASCVGVREAADRELGVTTLPNYAIREVYFGTDRKPETDQNRIVRFGSERGGLIYGVAKVSVPRIHKLGELETPSALKFEFRADPDKHVVLQGFETLDRPEVLTRVATALGKSSRRDLLVFVHGYNVSFDDAARRTAQIAYDTGFKGLATFFSWPSSAAYAGYAIDEENVSWAMPHLKEFMSSVADIQGVERVFVLGHSMGTRALSRAVVALSSERPALRSKFREIILAAPDIDADIFLRDIAPSLVATGAGVTIYSSSSDAALKASRALRGGLKRAGDADGGVIVFPGIESIDASNVDTSLIGHSYYGDNRSIISDIFYILGKQLRAKERAGLSEQTIEQGVFWRFKK